MATRCQCKTTGSVHRQTHYEQRLHRNFTSKPSTQRPRYDSGQQHQPSYGSGFTRRDMQREAEQDHDPRASHKGQSAVTRKAPRHPTRGTRRGTTMITNPEPSRMDPP